MEVGAGAASSSDLPLASQLEGQAHAEAKASEDTYALDSESSMEVREASSVGPASPRRVVPGLGVEAVMAR